MSNRQKTHKKSMLTDKLVCLAWNWRVRLCPYQKIIVLIFRAHGYLDPSMVIHNPEISKETLFNRIYLVNVFIDFFTNYGKLTILTRSRDATYFLFLWFMFYTNNHKTVTCFLHLSCFSKGRCWNVYSQNVYSHNVYSQNVYSHNVYCAKMSTPIMSTVPKCLFPKCLLFC